MSNASGLDRTDVARCWAGFASLGAGLIHIAVVREHLAESPSHGIFFAVVGLAQVGWGFWALSSRTVPFPRVTVAATLGLIALWGVSRTVGLSLNPLTAVPEAVGVADVLSVVLEAALIGCVLVAMPRAARPPVEADRIGRSVTNARSLALLAAGALAVSALATPAMAATEAGEHAHDHHGAVVERNHTH